MYGPFVDMYWKASITEVETLEAMNTHEVVDCTEDMKFFSQPGLSSLNVFLMDLSKSSKPGFAPEEISRSKALISLKHMLLLFNGQQFI